jgi:predicted transcriptional regulator
MTDHEPPGAGTDAGVEAGAGAGLGAGGGRRAPGALENEVLAALWAVGAPATAATVRTQLSGDLAYTTVLTILSRLHDKGLVTRERAGRGYHYSPVRDEAGHTAAGMRALLEKGGDRAAVLARFVSELPSEDERLLEQLLRGHPGD